MIEENNNNNINNNKEIDKKIDNLTENIYKNNICIELLEEDIIECKLYLKGIKIFLLYFF